MIRCISDAIRHHTRHKLVKAIGVFVLWVACVLAVGIAFSPDHRVVHRPGVIMLSAP